MLTTYLSTNRIQQVWEVVELSSPFCTAFIATVFFIIQSASALVLVNPFNVYIYIYKTGDVLFRVSFVMIFITWMAWHSKPGQGNFYTRWWKSSDAVCIAFASAGAWSLCQPQRLMCDGDEIIQVLSFSPQYHYCNIDFVYRSWWKFWMHSRAKRLQLLLIECFFDTFSSRRSKLLKSGCTAGDMGYWTLLLPRQFMFIYIIIFFSFIFVTCKHILALQHHLELF